MKYVIAFRVSCLPATDTKDRRMVIRNCDTGKKHIIHNGGDALSIPLAVAFIQKEYEVTISRQFDSGEYYYLIAE